MGNLEKARETAKKIQESNKGGWHNNVTFLEMMDILAAYHYSPDPKPEPPKYKVGDQVIGTGDLVKDRLLQIKGEHTTKGGWWNMEDGSAWPEEWLRHATPEEIRQPEFKPDQWVMFVSTDGRRHGPLQVIRKDPLFNDSWILDDDESYHVGMLSHATDAEKFRPGAVVEYKDDRVEIKGEINLFEIPCVMFTGISHKHWYIKYCTLITAAPAGEE